MVDWFPTGVTDYEHFSLERDVVKELRDTVRACEEREPLPTFFSDIEHAIACYRAHSKLKEDCLPGKVRGRLVILQTQSQQLLDYLDSLDGLSSMLLCEEKVNLSDMRHRLMEFVIAIGRAATEAESFPNSRVPDYPRTVLASDIRHALEKQGFRCKTTKSGLFYNVLGIIVRVATGNPHSSGAVEKLVAKALTHPTPTQILPDRS
ncbi:MAG: hypothetical protein RKO24_15635 [Candidatus Competibacter sp.]|nr:hypothetical protein [Candidatus Contendobacter sp.]MDS4071043.1 hypothetical protein [Candidatus Competibacter sp.]